MEFELVYIEATVQHFKDYILVTLSKTYGMPL